MKIVDERIKNFVRFNKLKCGDVFLSCTGEAWMKTLEMAHNEEIYPEQWVKHTLNAIRLSDGTPGFYFLDELITPVPKAELILND